MELFRNTNFDFLKWKWPFITASLVVTAAGFISLAVKGGPNYGIDFRGGAQMRLRFATEPPMDKIRKALDEKVPGSSLQQVTGAQEVEVVTPIKNEKELNANRQVMEDTLRGMFADSEREAGREQLLRGDVVRRLCGQRCWMRASRFRMQQLQEVATNIEDFRNDEQGGLLKSFDELSSVKGVTPQIIAALKKECVLGPFTILSADVVGPKIGADLQRQAIEATLYALAGMLVYIWFRFEWIYGVAAVVAVFHDTLITIGLFSLINKEISLTVVAALLTLVGYSMNDTIVTFDRIRENLKILRREKLEHLINISVNQTLSRTVLTSGLTLMTALSLWLFGGEVLNGFSFALVWGSFSERTRRCLSPVRFCCWGRTSSKRRKRAAGGGAARRCRSSGEFKRRPAGRVCRGQGAGPERGRAREGDARSDAEGRGGDTMFDQTFVDGVGKTHKSWTVTLSFALELLVSRRDGFDSADLDRSAAEGVVGELSDGAGSAAASSSASASSPQVIKVVHVAPRQFNGQTLQAPREIPKQVAMITEDALPPSNLGGPVGGVEGGIPGGTGLGD